MSSNEDILGKKLIKNFSSAVITWELERFKLMTSGPMVIYSPPITLLGPVETVWNMNLRIPKKHKDRLLLNVEMSPNNKRQKVKLHWSFCILDETEKASFSHERSFSYKPKTVRTVEYLTLNEMLEIANKKKYDNLILKCRMLVDFGMNIDFPKLKVAEFENLSNALCDLPTSFLYHDTTATVTNVEFSLHKAMLFFRGTKLVRFMEQSSNVSENFFLSKAKAATAVFRYLYSGNLKFILDDPCLTISDYIEHLEIPEIEDLYYPQRITVSSKIEFKEHTTIWSVDDFKNITRTAVGPEFKIEGLSRFLLSLDVKESEDDPPKKSLSVEVKLVEMKIIESKKLVVCLDFAFGKDENQMLCTRKIHGVMRPEDKLGVILLENDCPEMKEMFLNETLLIKVQVYTRLGDVLSYIVENKKHTSTEIPNKDSFKSFTQTLKEMKKTAVYSDIHFKVDEQDIKAHKFLVAARSPVMNELFRRDEGLQYVMVHDYTKEIFEELLHYMYIGILRETDGEKLIELYHLGQQYDVDGLLKVVPRMLSKSINETNMLRIQAFADEIEDGGLKEDVLNYVTSKGNTLQNHEGHDMLRNKKLDVYSEIFCL